MSRSRRIRISTVITYVLLLLVILGVIGFLAYFTGGFTGDFKTFYVVRGDTRILSDRELIIPLNREQRFDVKYTFGFIDKDQPKGYEVKVMPNVAVEEGFEYRVDGRKYQFGAEPELTAAFDIACYEGYFTLTMTAKTVEEVLQALYAGQTVEGVPELKTYAAAHFALVVTSYNGETVIRIDIRAEAYVEGITIEPGEVIF